jgi:hypothetical protein
MPLHTVQVLVALWHHAQQRRRWEGSNGAKLCHKHVVLKRRAQEAKRKANINSACWLAGPLTLLALNAPDKTPGVVPRLLPHLAESGRGPESAKYMMMLLMVLDRLISKIMRNAVLFNMQPLTCLGSSTGGSRACSMSTWYTIPNWLLLIFAFSVSLPML